MLWYNNIYLVADAFSWKGSNVNETRLTPFRFKSRIFLATADINPPDLDNEPVSGIDIILLNIPQYL